MNDLFLLLFFASIIALIVGITKPTTFARFLKDRATRKGTAIIFGIATIVFFVLFGITTDTKSQGEPVAYVIVESDDLSIKAMGNKLLSDFTLQELAALPTNKRMRYRIVVGEEIKENQVRPTIEKIISDITSQDNDIDEISLALYSNKELANSSYDVAMATWAPNGKWGNITAEIAESNNRSNYRITVEVKENLEEYLQQRGQSEEKFGLTEAERRQIFKEMVAAEDRARVEAEQMYPTDSSKPNYKQENIMKNIDKETELSKKYKAEVRTKYGITEDIKSKITTEAFHERWPLK